MAKKSRRAIEHERWIEDEVREIDAMFGALRRSYDALPDKSRIDESLITFDGFDANSATEDKYLRIAGELEAVCRDVRAFDSHMPRLRGYQMMLQAWRRSRDKENLTREDILRIIYR